ncbi:MAG: pentapeptide repeat-containing protein [Nodosilinea sp.]
MAQMFRDQPLTAQVSTSRVEGTLYGLPLRRLLAWSLEVGLLVGSIALPWGLGEMVRSRSQADLVPLNPVASFVQSAIARPLGLPRQRLVTQVPPLTNWLWFSAVVLPGVLTLHQFHSLAKAGKTLPKAWLGLQVIRLDHTMPGYRAVVVREGLGRFGLPLSLAYLIWIGSGTFPALPPLAGMALVLGLMEGLTAQINRSGRAYHDYLAGTRVVLLRGGQLPSKYWPERQTSPQAGLGLPSLPAFRSQGPTLTEEHGGLRAIVLSPLVGGSATPPASPRFPLPLNLPRIGAWMTVLAVIGVAGLGFWTHYQSSQRQGKDDLFLALVEKVNLHPTDVTEQQAAVLALASSNDPRATTFLVELLAQTEKTTLLNTLQAALVSVGTPAIPPLQRLNRALTTDLLTLAPDQAREVRLQQQTVKQTLAKILILASGKLNELDLSTINLAREGESPSQFTLNLEQQNLAGTIWRGAQLEGARFRKAILFNVGEDGQPHSFDDWVTDFSDSNLTEASFVAAHLTAALFHNSHLLRANLSNSQADYADFSGADASSAWFIAATLNHGQFNQANLVGADLTAAQLQGTSFLDTRLDHATLVGADLTNANLSRSDLTEVDLSNANLREANLTQVNLSHSRLNDGDLSNANLENANLQNANLTGTLLKGARLTGTNLAGVTFFVAEKRQPEKFITTILTHQPGDNLKGVDFSKAINLDPNQLDYLCHQGAIHPDCSPTSGGRSN